MKPAQTKQLSVFGSIESAADASEVAEIARHNEILRIGRGRRGARYWRDLTAQLLHQACRQLSEREVAFLANVQQSAHRGVVPTNEQVSWIRSIQERTAESNHGS
jgi:hypothetical protein